LLSQPTQWIYKIFPGNIKLNVIFVRDIIKFQKIQFKEKFSALPKSGTGAVLSLEEVLINAAAPVLIVSSLVGRGNYEAGEALLERVPEKVNAFHLPIEELVPASVVHEDLERYRFISNHFRFFLKAIYKIPVFYYRKYFREKYLKTTNLEILKEKMADLKPRTVICISHRPAFWISLLKYREGLDFQLWGLLTEFGQNLGWRYIFWEALNGFLSPNGLESLKFIKNINIPCFQIEPPCKKKIFELASVKPDIKKILMVAGYWGQISFNQSRSIIEQLLNNFPGLAIKMVTGTNQKLRNDLEKHFGNNERLDLLGTVPSLFESFRECGCLITKPGFSTLVEAHVAGRKIFLIRGMPVAEDNNARYALKHFEAEWFSLKSFKKWFEGIKSADCQ
jgi:UDP-N-acetylglucosamine:LPS N-acetylglucosamine transferase